MLCVRLAIAISCYFGIPVLARNSSYRLPVDLKPLAYNLSIVTDLEGFKFFGEVLIEFLCTKDTSTIHLHASPRLKIGEKVMLEGGGLHCASQCFREVSYEEHFEYLVLKTVNRLKAGRKYLMKLSFSKDLNLNPTGYYRSGYLGSDSNTTRWMASTNFETAFARSAFPCFDEPSLKAKFRIRLGHRNTYRSVCNMPLAKLLPMENRKEWFWSEFEESAPMSTYLVGWVVSQLEYRESDPIGKDKFRVWARPEALNHTSLALSVGPKFLKFYEEYFRIKYPLPKLDLIAIPEFPSSAMENWGLITFRENNLLYDASRPSIKTKEDILNTVAHEIAHQWFGNLVTMKWWTDLWLKEGFATYLGALAMNKVLPSNNFIDEDSMNEIMDVLELDALKSSHPISATVQTASDADEIFDTISYEKGSMLIRMMHHFLGGSFREGLTRYLKSSEYSNADQDDLWAALSSQAHEDGVLPNDTSVKMIMDSWTMQTGYPVLKVARNYQTGVVYVSQSRFSLDKIAEKGNNCWWFPLTYTSRSQAHFDGLIPKHWLKCGQEQVEIRAPSLGPSDWLVVNLKLSGLARVLYDPKNWDLLIQTLDSNGFETIHEMNRGGLIDDAFRFADKGDLPYETAVRLSKYLSRESSFLPLNRAMTVLDVLRLKFERTPNYNAFKGFMRKILTPLFHRFNMSHQPLEHETQKINVLISEFACLYEIQSCLEQSKALYDGWVAGKNSIPFDLQLTVLCNAVKYGGESSWNHVFNKFSKSDNPGEFKFVLWALACTPNEKLINRYLDWTLTEDKGINKHEAGRIFGEIIYRSPIGFDSALKYLENNFGRIYKYHQPLVANMVQYILSVGSHITYRHELDTRFIRANSKFMKGIQMVVQQSLERAVLSVEWHEKHYDTVSRLIG